MSFPPSKIRSCQQHIRIIWWLGRASAAIQNAHYLTMFLKYRLHLNFCWAVCEIKETVKWHPIRLEFHHNLVQEFNPSTVVAAITYVFSWAFCVSSHRKSTFFKFKLKEGDSSFYVLSSWTLCECFEGVLMLSTWDFQDTSRHLTVVIQMFRK